MWKKNRKKKKQKKRKYEKKQPNANRSKWVFNAKKRLTLIRKKIV